MLGFGQQLMLLAMACLALQTAHGWFLPKLDAKLEAKKQKELLKKLDFLNLFTEKEEAKLEKKEDEWEKFKQWWEEKKEKELSFFEAKKEKELAFFEGKLSKKSGKKSKSRKTTVKPCYGYGYQEPAATANYYSEEVTAEEYEESESSEEVTEKPRRKYYERRPTYSQPTIYDVRDDSAEGTRYFT
ncbi:glutamic acid-rich protein [Drosophila takahashii]|uniref:glutamic acid-rich protein n=1 Tax=Drosophila takahashii TaxID=29030 RepID=UPI001CF8CCE2|nr:uncharacterized protein LOC108060840 [Drosophila takahashii]